MIKVNNQYGYNIYNDELKVAECENIIIVKSNYDINNETENITSNCLLKSNNIKFKVRNLKIKDFIIAKEKYYLVFINEVIGGKNKNIDEITISHKPFIYPLKDYDESLPYDKQTGECSKILNYYIDLIEKVK